MATTRIPISPTRELRIQVRDPLNKTASSEKLVEVRDYHKERDGTWKPSGSGVLLSPAVIDRVIEGLQKAQNAAAVTVLHMSDQPDDPVARYVISKSAAQALVSKKVYGKSAEAQAASPPDGYHIFRALVQAGAVVKLEPEYPLYDRTGGEWKHSKEYNDHLHRKQSSAASRPGPGAPAKKAQAKRTDL